MTVLPMNSPIRRRLTRDELTTIIDRIDATNSTADLLTTVVRAVYDVLLADLGLSLDALPNGQQLDPRLFLIPTRQWEAITGAATGRAAAWGTGPALALELVNLMPGTYQDPAAPVPDRMSADRRPAQLDLHLSRDAVDVIAAAGHHLQALAAYYGPTSKQYLAASSSWLSGLSQMLTMSFGAGARVVRDGTLSLLIHASSGFTFAVIFHGDRRQCTAGDGCTAAIADDGTAHAPYAGTVLANHEHRPSFPLDAPRPGTWSLHS